MIPTVVDCQCSVAPVWPSSLLPHLQLLIHLCLEIASHVDILLKASMHETPAEHYTDASYTLPHRVLRICTRTGLCVVFILALQVRKVVWRVYVNCTVEMYAEVRARFSKKHLFVCLKFLLQ